MKILFIGDIYGESGIKSIKNNLSEIIDKLNVDLVIANAENASLNGKGLNYKDYKTLEKYGINFFTLGNHAFRNKDIYKYIDNSNNLVRPYNWEGLDIPGKGTNIIEWKGKKIRITSLLGQTFINEPATNPFLAIEEIIENDTSDIHIVDFHAEATSEKNIMGFKMDGRVSAVIGTHTHVQTSDSRINPKGSFYITDVGMTGPTYSSIGADLEDVYNKTVTGLPYFFSESKYTGQFSAIVMNFNDKTNKSIDCKRIFIEPEFLLKKI